LAVLSFNTPHKRCLPPSTLTKIICLWGVRSHRTGSFHVDCTLEVHVSSCLVCVVYCRCKFYEWENVHTIFLTTHSTITIVYLLGPCVL